MVAISLLPPSGRIAEAATSWGGERPGHPRQGFLGSNAAYSLAGGLRIVPLEGIETAFAGSRAHQPVSTALQCVTALAVSFFGAYLAVISIRLVRTGCRWLAGTNMPVTVWERKLVEATGGLAMAPMLSVLLVSARLRSLHLDPSRGLDPAPWVQGCMIAGTAAFFVRIALDLSLSCLDPDTLAGWAVQRVAYLCSCAIYTTSMCILLYGTWASHPVDDTASRHEVSPMVVCMSILIVVFLLETALFEVIAATRRHLRQQAAAAAAAAAAVAAPVLRPRGVMHHFGAAQEVSFLELVPLHFPIMICVLLVGIELRALQLHLQPPLWSAAAMYIATACLFAQASWACAMSLLRSFPRGGDRGSSGAGGGEERNLQGEEEGGFAPAGFYKPLGVALASTWVLVLCGLYAGTAAVLVSVFAMEERPLGLLLPPPSLGAAASALLTFSSSSRAAEEHFALEDAAGHGMGAGVPPVSVAMRCVTLLTTVYFAFYLGFVVCGALQGRLRKWVQAVLSNVQCSLAFVPMLCVMMIAVRLRAMQLGIRDPQPWAQVVMITAAMAVIVQSVCNLFIQEDLAELSMASKLVYILMLLVRNLAAGVLFGAVAALIAALLLMRAS